MPAPTLTLVNIAGPTVGPFTIRPGGQTLIGRAADAPVCLIDEGVSRRHATLAYRRGEWFITDEDSTAGTHVNGVRLAPRSPTPVEAGDLLRIGPWTLRAVVGRSQTRSAPTVDDADTATSRLQTAQAQRVTRTDRRLRLLSQCIGRVASAPDEETAARVIVELALQGSGYSRGAVIRRVQGGSGASRVEVLTAIRAGATDDEPFVFSRTLIDRASAGEAVVLTDQTPASLVSGASLVSHAVHSAMCVPIEGGGVITEFLYLDARGKEAHVRGDAAEFCEALATVYALASASIRRTHLERRQRELQEELDAAREVQQLVLPALTGRIGPARYAVIARPGSYIVGDLFDALELPGGRAAFCLGDVAGHGVGAGMLMATAQAFLHAELARLPEGSGPAAAVDALNKHLSHRPLGGRFLSLWVGIISPTGELAFTDAGHGHWVHLRRDVRQDRTDVREGGAAIPVGVDPEAVFRTTRLSLLPMDQIVLYSDGVIEQRSPAGEQFGMERLLAAIATGGSMQEDASLVMRELDRFANSPTLDDDATIATIEYVPG